MKRDYYAVLGVGAAASAAQIRRAYQRLARQYSPDVNLWERDSRALFDEIAEAYRVLSDPIARVVYDRRPESRERARGEAEPTSARPRGRRGDELHATVEVAFQQAVTGLTADLPIDRLSPCAPCGASGATPGSAPIACSYCGGLGTLWSGHGALRPESCPACEGSGARIDEACPVCRGRGVSVARTVLSVALPPGMDTGAQLRIEGEGHAGPFGGPRGDLIVSARVHDDPVFARKGDNLYCEVPVGLVEAVLGARVPICGVDGALDLVIPPGTQSGHVFRLRGRGMPRLSGAGRGDLFMTARVEVPRGLDAHTQELFREIGRLLPAISRSAAPRSARS
jgi:molecular chaperone DnaJ